MNQSQEQRLEEIFRKNENKEIAIAITGCWGIGKTFFWNNFFRNQTINEFETKENFYYEISKQQYLNVFENKKYAYVSLFGIESLDALKNEIAIKLGWNPYSQYKHIHYGIPQLLKNTLNQFKDIKLSQYGVSSSSRLIESLLFSQVKNAIICFDDFERMSKKLDVKDVMGLANQLKLERNCQVVLILDESKSDDDNQKKYAEYKEKLIDETVKITSVEPLIRENTKDMDESLVDLMVKFADELEIHNFRFFQKVIKLYTEFGKKLPKIIEPLVKEIILVRILEGFLIEDFSEEYSWESFLQMKASGNYKSFSEININFIRNDLREDFLLWFSQSNNFSFQNIIEYINGNNKSKEDGRFDKELSKFIKNYDQLNFHQKNIEDLSKLLKNINIHYSHLNLIRVFFIFEELNLKEYKSEIYNELQVLICSWISERVDGGNVERFLEYLSKLISKDTPFYKHAVNEIINKQQKNSNDIELSLQVIFQQRVVRHPSNVENEYLMSVSVDSWAGYLQSLDSRDYLFDNIKWIFIQIKKGVFDLQIKENIFSAFDKLANEDQIVKKYFSNQKKRLLKEAGF